MVPSTLLEKILTVKLKKSRRWKTSLKRLLIKVGTMSTGTSKVPTDIKETSGGDLQQNYLCKTFLLPLGFLFCFVLFFRRLVI